MNFRKRFLSCILATACLCSPTKKEEVRGSELILGGCVAAVLLGVIGYAIYSYYQEEKARKAEIQRRNTSIYFSTHPEKFIKIATQLVHKIPFSPEGNSMFDALLQCTNVESVTTWAALVAANGDWPSSTLDSICNTLLAFRIPCDVLREKVKTKRQEEQENAKLELEKEKIWVERSKIWHKDLREDRKLSSKERENEKDRQHDKEKQIMQHVHENHMQDKQHWHENDMNSPVRKYNY